MLAPWYLQTFLLHDVTHTPGHSSASSAPSCLPQPGHGPGFLPCRAFAPAAASACCHCPFFSAGLGDFTSPPGLGRKAIIPYNVSTCSSWSGSWDPVGLRALILSPDREADVSISWGMPAVLSVLPAFQVVRAKCLLKQ